MYKIERKSYGFLLTFSGQIEPEEMDNWLEDAKKSLAVHKGPFGLLLDMRTLKPLSDDVRKIMVQGQQLYKESGMTRSAVILANAVIQLQFRRLAKESGTYDWERYISAADTPNWEQLAINWITKEKDPDKRMR